MGQNTIRLFLATGKEQAAPSKMWSHLIKGTSALPVVLSEDRARLHLIMMFMEIISLKNIIGHGEQRDGDINHVTMTQKLIPYQLMQMDDKSDSVQETQIYFFSLWEAYPPPNAVLFHKLFFHKVFGVQRRGEQQSSPVAFNNTMATIQLQTSAGIGWSLHTLAPGAARSVCVCVCVWVRERERGGERERARETVIGGCTIGGVTWLESKALTCNQVRRKIIKMVSGQKPLHKIPPKNF